MTIIDLFRYGVVVVAYVLLIPLLFKYLRGSKSKPNKKNDFALLLKRSWLPAIVVLGALAWTGWGIVFKLNASDGDAKTVIGPCVVGVFQLAVLFALVRERLKGTKRSKNLR